MNSTDLTDVEVCTITHLGMEITGEDAPPIVEAINQYLSQFAKPVRREGGNNFSGSINCLNCGEILSGLIGTFTWGIAHGEAECGNCGWPCRAYHDIKQDGESVFNRPLDTILQYHPSKVNVRGKKDE